MIAIVTGSFGYIGSVLCKMLMHNGYRVIGIDNNPLSTMHDYRNRHQYCEQFIYGDFASEPALSIIKQHKDATIFHLAANSLLGPSAYDPLSYYENNTAKTLKLLQNIAPTNRLIFASTAAVYGITDKPVKESDTIDPPNNYGRSKLWCEQLFDNSYQILQNKITSFRFFNVIGGWGDVGQLPDTPHIVNQLCTAAKNDKPFTVYGNSYPTPDGTCVRDYLHVIDVVRALIHADKYMQELDNSCNLKYNLGTNRGTSVKQIIEAFNKVAMKVNVVYGDIRIGDPPFLVADPSKFIDDTGFRYNYNEVDIDLMIDSAWRYSNGI